MPDWSSIESVALAFALLSPGFLLMFGRSRFLTGRMTNVASSVFEYLMATSVYFAIIYPFAIKSTWSVYTQFVIFLLIVPLVLGLSVGWGTKRNLFQSLKDFLKIDTVHYAPTAWDFAFGNLKGKHWVVVNLFSGGKYYGVIGENSLASSDLSNMDIFLENICHEDFSFVEGNQRKRGVWINQLDIRSIEIVKD